MKTTASQLIGSLAEVINIYGDIEVVIREFAYVEELAAEIKVEPRLVTRTNISGIESYENIAVLIGQRYRSAPKGE